MFQPISCATYTLPRCLVAGLTHSVPNPDRLPRKDIRWRTIVQIHAVIVSIIIVSFAAVVLAPAARAAENVTYEVVSNSVRAANIEYFDQSERRVVEGASLPWRADATVVDALSPSSQGAEIRTDWRGYVPASPLPPGRPIGYWVTVRILLNGKVICQSTLDVGNATCYGYARFNS